MNLRDLHLRLSKDASFRKKYAELGDTVELAMHARTVREELEITQQELAQELGISAFDISQFEDLKRANDHVICALVDRFEVPLRRRGVNVEKWLSLRKNFTTREPGATPRPEPSVSVQRPRPNEIENGSKRGLRVPTEAKEIKKP